MKRLALLSVLATLAVPSLAQADVVLEPGTKLTVVCPKHSFVGEPFTVDASGESFTAIPAGIPRRRYFGIGGAPNAGIPGEPGQRVIVQRRRVKEMRGSRRLFSITVAEGGSVRWHGC